MPCCSCHQRRRDSIRIRTHITHASIPYSDKRPRTHTIGVPASAPLAGAVAGRPAAPQVAATAAAPTAGTAAAAAVAAAAVAVSAAAARPAGFAPCTQREAMPCPRPPAFGLYRLHRSVLVGARARPASGCARATGQIMNAPRHAAGPHKTYNITGRAHSACHTGVQGQLPAVSAAATTAAAARPAGAPGVSAAASNPVAAVAAVAAAVAAAAAAGNAAASQSQASAAAAAAAAAVSAAGKPSLRPSCLTHQTVNFKP